MLKYNLNLSHLFLAVCMLCFAFGHSSQGVAAVHLNVANNAPNSQVLDKDPSSGCGKDWGLCAAYLNSLKDLTGGCSQNGSGVWCNNEFSYKGEAPDAYYNVQTINSNTDNGYYHLVDRVGNNCNANWGKCAAFMNSDTVSNKSGQCDVRANGVYCKKEFEYDGGAPKFSLDVKVLKKQNQFSSWIQAYDVNNTWQCSANWKRCAAILNEYVPQAGCKTSKTGVMCDTVFNFAGPAY